MSYKRKKREGIKSYVARVAKAKRIKNGYKSVHAFSVAHGFSRQTITTIEDPKLDNSMETVDRAFTALGLSIQIVEIENAPTSQAP